MSYKTSDLSFYIDPRIPRILLLGTLSGFPALLIGAVLTLWLREYEISRTVVGFIGFVSIVYTFNWIAAPFIDRAQIPVLTKLVGHRKSWILLMQILILSSLFTWSFLSPENNLFWIGLIALLIAISSALQDITIDALRIEQYEINESKGIAAGAATAVVGWMVGFKLGKMLLLSITAWLEANGYQNFWNLSFQIVCLIIILLNLFLLLIPEKVQLDKFDKQDEDQLALLGKETSTLDKVSKWFASTIANPLISYFKKNGFQIGLLILSFLFLFKLGEAFLGKMSSVFYDDIGYSKYEIAIFSGLFGFITFAICTYLGSWFSIKSGIIKALFISGILMALTNLLFTAIAWGGKSQIMFAVAILFDDLAAAFATVAFVTFISLLVDRTYTATQYALLSSLATGGMKTFAAFSGVMVDWLQGDWGTFFIITALMVIPSLILLWFIRNKIAFN